MEHVNSALSMTIVHLCVFIRLMYAYPQQSAAILHHQYIEGVVAETVTEPHNNIRIIGNTRTNQEFLVNILAVPLHNDHSNHRLLVVRSNTFV